MSARLGRSHRQTTRDDGFTLLEMIISMVIITVVLAALTGLFVTSITSSNHLRKVQTASRLATSSLDFARSIGATGAKKNRTTGPVQTQFQKFAPTPVGAWLTGMTPAVDNYPSGTADLSTTATAQVVDNVTYNINYLVGICHRSSSLASTPQKCDTAASAATAVEFVRVVVAISWRDRSCTPDTCYFIAATLLNGDNDPQFNFRIDPPPPPVLSQCTNQTVTVGQSVRIAVFPAADLGATAAPICQLDGGTPSFDWLASALPDGLTLDAQTGLITGTVAAPTAAGGDQSMVDTQTQITVHDGQNRPSAGTFTWHVVLGELTLTTPTGIVAAAGQPVGPLPIAFDGGSGQYTVTVANQPSWIALDGTPEAGYTLSGTPQSGDAGSGTLELTVTDAVTNLSASFPVAILVTTANGPAVPTPGERAWAVGEAVTMDVSATCADGTTCTWNPPVGLPEGLTWQAAADSGIPNTIRATISGTPTTAASGTITISASSGQNDFGGSMFAWQVTP